MIETYWAPSGALTIETALKTLTQGEQHIANSNKQCVIDLSKIDSIDSVGVAVLLEWQRYANQQDKKIKLTHPPLKLQSMIRLSALENVLNVE